MPKGSSPRIHPTAVISPEAELSDNVEVGPFTVIEGKVRLGPGCTIVSHARLVGPLTMGAGNSVYPGAVLGERPQHVRYADEPTGLEIGDRNIFREYVTVHRGTTHSWTTRIGDDNFFMVNSHVAHDCQIGNRCILANGALLAGHCVLEDSVFLSGNSAVHQFVRMGRLSLLSGCSGTSKDTPPFVIQQGWDNVSGVNVVGMRRAGMSVAEITAVRKAFRYIYHERMVLPAALGRIERELMHFPAVAEMVEFIRHAARGINPMRGRHSEAA